jgi:hypothetical protein
MLERVTMTVAETLDHNFPKELEVTSEVTMEQVGAMRDALRQLLPDGSSVDLTLMMNVLLLSVWAPADGRYNRQCVVKTKAGTVLP